VLLAERATGVRLALQDGAIPVTAPPGSMIRRWNRATTTLHAFEGTETTLLLPPDDPSDPSAAGCAG
jgi:helicase